MIPTLKISEKPSLQHTQLVLVSSRSQYANYAENQTEKDYMEQHTHKKSFSFFRKGYMAHLIFLTEEKEKNKRAELLRKAGNEWGQLLRKNQDNNIEIITKNIPTTDVLHFLEGLLLGNYEFLKYKTKPESSLITSINVIGKAVKEEQLQELSRLVQATFMTRDLVNEPVIYLNAEQLAEEIKQMGKKAGFSTKILKKSDIKELKMGGLLAVNAGSVDKPTFSVLEYKPENALNAQPIVLVGKGIVFDTGGLSLKPTPHSMDSMKCDMAGAAAVAGTFFAVAQNQLPIYLIGLIPATDNRPGGNAIAPSDVITMMSGTTVEVRNTDAEGRLILADALHYAKQYQPELVIDLATLTGAAVRAIGTYGSVMFGTAPEAVKKNLQQVGEAVYERLVEFPIWEEYEEEIKSDIADLKNLGSDLAGATTAAAFLKHFTDYPWIHLDIAGTAWLDRAEAYKPKNATGTGVRLLYHFLKERCKKS